MPAYVKSVRYSETPTNILMQQAQYARQEQMLMQRAEMENEKARRAIPMGLADKLKNIDADVANSDASAAVADLSQRILQKSVPTEELYALSSQYLTRISAKSQAAKQFKKQIEEGLKGLDKYGVDKGRLRDAATAYLVANINDPDKLSNGYAFIENAMNEPALFVDRRIGTGVIQGIIKQAPKVTVSDIVTVDADGTKKLVSGFETKLAPWYRVKESVNPTTNQKTFETELKLSPDGAIDEQVFNQFYNFAAGPDDYRVKMTIDAGAQDLINRRNEGKKIGDKGYLDPKDVGTVDLAKRAYLTDVLKAMTTPEFSRKSVVDVAAPKAAKGTDTSTASDADLGRYPRMVAIAKASKDKNTVQINQMEGGDQGYVLDLMSKVLGRKANASEFDLRLQADGKFAILAAKKLMNSDSEVMFKPGQQISTLNPDQIVGAEAKQVGGIKLARAVAKPKQTTGKKVIPWASKK